jgi:hypothetical protein
MNVECLIEEKEFNSIYDNQRYIEEMYAKSYELKSIIKIDPKLSVCIYYWIRTWITIPK